MHIRKKKQFLLLQHRFFHNTILELLIHTLLIKNYIMTLFTSIKQVN